MFNHSKLCVCVFSVSKLLIKLMIMVFVGFFCVIKKDEELAVLYRSLYARDRAVTNEAVISSSQFTEKWKTRAVYLRVLDVEIWK